jgi:hypothetical protein
VAELDLRDGYWSELRFLLFGRFSLIKGYVTKSTIIVKNSEIPDTTKSSGGKLN